MKFLRASNVLSTSLGIGLLFFLFQNCSEVQFAPLNLGHSKSKQEIYASEGGGEVYDGKIRILHHYVSGFQCEGRDQPESILIRTDETKWVYTLNTKEKCALIDREPVTGVIYDDVAKQAVYQGKIHVPPIPFYVDATENPNLPDKKLLDGVCENINNKCSLLAAVQQAGLVTTTSDSIVEIPASRYLLNAPLPLRLSSNNHGVHLRGANSQSTALSGQNSITPLVIFGPTGKVTVESLSFVNGRATPYTGTSVGTVASAAITLDFLFKGSLSVIDSQFNNNTNGSVIYGGPAAGLIRITRSSFQDNQSGLGVIQVFGVEGLIVEDSFIFRNTGSGIMIENDTSQVAVRRTTVADNTGKGIIFHQCADCLIENSTIYNNRAEGFDVWSNNWNSPHYAPIIKNTTIYGNGIASGKPNLQIAFGSVTQKLLLYNSVIATGSSSHPNCGFISSSTTLSTEIVATNSLFDDNSCDPTGPNNLIGVFPLLGAFMQNGGLWPTLAPQSGSPLIDAGDNDSCLNMDQNNFPRPIDSLGRGALCDIGAVENQ